MPSRSAKNTGIDVILPPYKDYKLQDQYQKKRVNPQTEITLFDLFF